MVVQEKKNKLNLFVFFGFFWGGGVLFESLRINGGLVPVAELPPPSCFVNLSPYFHSGCNRSEG